MWLALLFLASHRPVLAAFQGLAQWQGRQLSGENSAFVILAGHGCEVVDNCLTSTRRRRYGPKEHCDVRVLAGPLSVTEFAVASSDYVEVASASSRQRLSGTGSLAEALFLHWTSQGAGEAAGWSICAQPASTAPAVPLPSEMEKPFAVLAGHGCEVQGDCLASSRRRRYSGGDWCVAQVAHGLGPLAVPELETGDSDDVLWINQVGFTGTYDDSNAGLRPYGAIRWSADNDAEGSGWRVCATNIDDDLQHDSAAANITDVWNGANGVFNYAADASARTIARLACESVYGPNSCSEGSCRCFQYFYRAGSTSCTCGKVEGEYEWVFKNNGCQAVSEDYSGVRQEPGGTLLENGVASQLFVRKRLSGCGVQSWELTSLGIGPDKRLPNRHLVLDLRAAHYVAGSNTWSNLVPGMENMAASVDNSLYDPEEQSFSFGSVDGFDAFIVDLEGAHSQTATWVVWAKFPNQGPLPTDAVLSLYLNSTTISSPRAIDLSPLGVNTGTWVHIAVVWDGHNSETYVDGQYKRTEAVAQLEVGNILRIGGSKAYPNPEKTGLLHVSDVAVFNRTLSSTEVGDLYASGRPSGMGVIAAPRMCKFTGVYDDLARVLTLPAKFTITSGEGCYLHFEGNCVSSARRRRANYEASDVCGITVNYDGPMTVNEFDTENIHDTLKFTNASGSITYFSGTNGPKGNEQPATMEWWSDRFGGVSTGWSICAEAGADDAIKYKASLHFDCLRDNNEDADMQLLSALIGSSARPCSASSSDCQTTVVGSMKLEKLCPMTCNVASSSSATSPGVQATASPLWSTVAGNCSALGKCASSPFFPLTALSNEACSLQAASTLATVAIEVPDTGSWEARDGNTALGPDESQGVFPASTIVWNAGGRSSSGWSVCSSAAAECGSTCALAASVSCHDSMLACGASVLQPAAGAAQASRPHAPAAACSDLAWVQLDLGKSTSLGWVGLLGAQGQRHCGRQVELSEDGSNWTTVYRQAPGYGPAEGGSGSVLPFRRQAARFVRVSTSRSLAEPFARFLRITLADTCEDDASWTDSEFGDGTETCGSLGSHPAWCISRALYSIEAQKACPRTCGDCGEVFQPLEQQTCQSEAMIDETTGADHVVSSLACFRHCLAAGRCTHFEWLPGQLCRRLRGCKAQAPTPGSTLKAYVISKKEAPMRPLIDKLQWKGFLNMRSSGRCSSELGSLEECLAQVVLMGLPAVKGQGSSGGCKYLRESGVVSMTTEECSAAIPCLCSEWSTTAFPVANHVPSEAQALLTPHMLDMVIRDRQSALVSPVCNMVNNGCLGKSVTLRRLELPHRLGQVYPYPVDWNMDGYTDLLLGRSSGHLVYVESVGGDLDLTAATGISKVGGVGGSSSCYQVWESPTPVLGNCSHWCCHVPEVGDVCLDGYHDSVPCSPATSWGVVVNKSLVPIPFDYDGDGDLDLLTASCDGTLQLWRRDGGTAFTKMPAESDPFQVIVSGQDAGCLYPEVVDWDGDGDLDLLLGRETGYIDMFENKDGTYHPLLGKNNPLHNLKVGRDAVPAAIDFDGDGDVDLLVGSSTGQVDLYDRVDHGNVMHLGALPGIQVNGSSIPRAVDWDADGDIDLFVANGDTGELWLWVADTVVSVVEREDRFNPFREIATDRVPIPQVVDFDGDGRLDVLIAEATGRLRFFHGNERGISGFTQADEMFNSTLQLGVGAAIQVIDWDSDGDLDLLEGQEGGRLLLHEFNETTRSFALGRPLLQSPPSPAFGTYPAPHVVDWDGDGDLDLIVGDSGDFPPLSMRMDGFPFTDWNVWFREYGGVTIGGSEAFVTDSGEWVFAWCQPGDHWFIFQNTAVNLQVNKAGEECIGAVAKRPSSPNLWDWNYVGMPFLWSVRGDYIYSEGTSPPDNIKAQIMSSEGTLRNPHCVTCDSKRERPECGSCSLSDNMRHICATELCNNQGFDTAGLSLVEALPKSQCQCADADQGATDAYGRGCSEYSASWCGMYDFATTGGFSSVSMCCVCGGGVHGNGSDVQEWQVRAQCYNRKAVYLDGNYHDIVGTARIAEMLPDLRSIGLGSLRYFERTGANSFTEHVGSDNPFQALVMYFGARLFPTTVDWNADGKLDLVLGSSSKISRTYIADRVPGKPVCAWTDFDGDPSCSFNMSVQRTCIRQLCRKAGFVQGIPLDEFTNEHFCQRINDYGRTGEVYYVKNASVATSGTGLRINSLCFQGGSVRYFEQQVDGTLHEKEGEMNPLNSIVSRTSAALQIVDFDADGEPDVVVGDDSGKLRYFKKGEPCQHHQPCNGKGLCDPVYGTCTCVKGHSLSDCSQCLPNYYSLLPVNPSVGSCMPCPGLDSEAGLCANRGTCSDDDAAREAVAAAGGSNLSLVLASGSGDCTCSSDFSGQNDLGLSSCNSGECKPGQQLLASSGLTFSVCSPCLAGSAKPSRGNGLCKLCPEGRFAENDSAVECAPCPGGRFQEREGQASCQPCLLATYSQSGSSTCTECPIGRFADKAEMSECSRCPPGHWSSQPAAQQCVACDAGKFSSGLEPCQPCASGSYATVKGMSACTLCSSGRYSAVREATSGTVCQACDIGKYGESAGATSEDQCLPCAVGATTASQATADITMCIEPNPGNFTCISGRPCAIHVGGNRLRDSHKLALSLTASGLVEGGVTKPSHNGSFYQWPEPFTLGGDLYQLSWCPGLHGPCNELPDFAFVMGVLDVTGPVEKSFTCIRGKRCDALGPLPGRGLLPSDALQLQVTCGFGPPIAIAAENPNGLAQDIALNASGDMTFGFGQGFVTAKPSELGYEICWCANERGWGKGCVAQEDFKVRAGLLRVLGPDTGQEAVCYLGQYCSMPGIQGVGMLPGDRLMVMDRCGVYGQPVQGVPDGSIAETTDGTDFKFPTAESQTAKAKEKVLMSFPGLFALCFCRPTEPGDCKAPGSFNARIGFFRARGPYSDHIVECRVPSECALDNMRGIGLAHGDEVTIQLPSQGDSCTVESQPAEGAHPAGLPLSQVPTKNRGKEFSFGELPANAEPGRYPLCWRPAGKTGAFLAKAGLLLVTCPPSTYRLQALSSASCAPCPRGFYCTGGNEESDGKSACKAGSTTLGERAEREDQCLCAPGFRLSSDGNRQCLACPQNTFKASVKDDTSCQACPEGMLSSTGAISVDQCYTEAASKTGNLTQAEVYVLTGVLQFQSCLFGDQKLRARLQLTQTLSDSLRVPQEEVTLKFGNPSASCALQNSSARRLQSQQGVTNVTYSIVQGTSQQAGLLNTSFNLAAIQAEMQKTLGVVLVELAAPSISQQSLDCKVLGEGWSFPPGSQPTSLTECTCDVGYGQDSPGLCEPCKKGLYKGSTGAVPCTPCGRASSEAGSVSVLLTTLRTGSVSEESCTCPPGHFEPGNASLKSCKPCGFGHYCLGGKARQKCPADMDTLVEDAALRELCRCAPGRQGRALAGGELACEPCLANTFKSTVGNGICSQSCPPNSESMPGAAETGDCYCRARYYAIGESNGTLNCQVCPVDGVDCPGGFDPPESRVHSAPRARAGYFMTGVAYAEQCFIEMPEGGSACLGGSTVHEAGNSCAGLQTGDLCGSCKHLSARDLGDQPCETCKGAYEDWVHVLNLNFDLLIKACFGIFLGNSAIKSVGQSKKVQAVIMRILLQWVTASSVLGAFDLSNVGLYEWSVESQTDEYVAENDVVGTATGLSFKFQFPPWFQPLWRSMTMLTGTVPSPISPQFSLECLVQGQMTPTSLPSRSQLLGPAVWWLAYPPLVMVWVVICCLILAKVIWPLVVKATAKSRNKLSARLMAAGASSGTVKSAVGDMSFKSIRKLLQDYPPPDNPATENEKDLLDAVGGDVYVEAAAAYLVDRAGPQILSMLGEVVALGRADEGTVRAAQEVLSSGLEFLSPFLVKLIGLIRNENPDLLEGTFTNPSSMVLAFRQFLEGKGLKDIRPSRQMGEEAKEHYVIFGLFRDNSVKTVVKDALPLYLVTMYSIWDVVTKRMLGLLQANTILVSSEGQTFRQARWLYDMRFSVFRGNHFVVGVVALTGLGLWSMGYLLFLFWVLRRNHESLTDRRFLRKFGYFINGLEADTFFWEVLVKKGDVLLLYVVTFTELFSDPKAKLITYLGCAGFFWAMHNMFHPYDDRQNALADRLEDFGLTVRFGTVFLLQILLMVAWGLMINAVFAVSIIVINFWFLANLFFVLVMENASGLGSSVKKMRPKKKKTVAEEASRSLKWFMERSVIPLARLLLKLLARAAGSKERAAKRVPSVQWMGCGLDVIVINARNDKLSRYEQVFNAFVSFLYKLGDVDQKSYIANSIGLFWDHVMNNSDCHALPSCLMDIFFTLPGCLKAELHTPSSDPNVVPLHLRVARRIRTILMDSGESQNTSALESEGNTPAEEGNAQSSTRNKASLMSTGSEMPTEKLNHINTGEDFNAALLFIQHLARRELRSFVLEASSTADSHHFWEIMSI